ncbi:MAG: sialidase family protein [Vicinamibacterales bacterium]
MNIGDSRKGAVVGGVAIGVGLLAWHVTEPRVTAQQRIAWTPTIVAIPSPAGSKTAEPQLTISNRGVLLSWIEHAGATVTLKLAERTATGWTEPRAVASGDNWSVNAVDAPSVLRLSDGTLAATWLQTSGSGMHDNDVRLSYSRDEGRTWSPSFAPYRDGPQKERLFVSLFETPARGLGLIWLDGGAMRPAAGNIERAVPNHTPGADHAHPQGAGHQGGAGHEGHGTMSDRGDMSVRFAAFDAAWKQIAEMLIDSRVCECCPTAAAVAAGGPIVAYRDRSADEIRDISVSRFVNGTWTTPVAAHNDGWKIAACPIDGPALSAAGKNVAIAWFTATGDQGHAFVAFSSDSGASFGAPVRLDDGSALGRVDVQLTAEGAAVATWIEFADGRAQFKTRVVDPSGQKGAAVAVTDVSAGRSSGYPRVAGQGDELVFAWTESDNGASRVRTAFARVPRSSTR